MQLCDSVDVELKQKNYPHNTLAHQRAALYTNGFIHCSFPLINDSCYIAIQSRNAIETWSASPLNLSYGSASYDFTVNANSAFGANQIQLETGSWAFYSGDLNQDQNIDLLDAYQLETAISSFEFGFTPNDVNGDGNVDLLDYPDVEENINNFIYSNHP